MSSLIHPKNPNVPPQPATGVSASAPPPMPSSKKYNFIHLPIPLPPSQSETKHLATPVNANLYRPPALSTRQNVLLSMAMAVTKLEGTLGPERRKSLIKGLAASPERRSISASAGGKSLIAACSSSARPVEALSPEEEILSHESVEMILRESYSSSAAQKGVPAPGVEKPKVPKKVYKKEDRQLITNELMKMEEEINAILKKIGSESKGSKARDMLTIELSLNMVRMREKNIELKDLNEQIPLGSKMIEKFRLELVKKIEKDTTPYFMLNDKEDKFWEKLLKPSEKIDEIMKDNENFRQGITLLSKQMSNYFTMSKDTPLPQDNAVFHHKNITLVMKDLNENFIISNKIKELTQKELDTTVVDSFVELYHHFRNTSGSP